MANSLNVLMIEGPRKGGRHFAHDLKKKGYSLQVESSGSKGLDALKHFSPDVIVINTASLRTNGLRLVSWFHNALPATPLCLIVAEDEPVAEAENVQFFLRLPFTVQKLVNRFRTLELNNHKGVLERGELLLNPESRIATYKNREVQLTPRLSELLAKMMEKPGVILRREDLFKAVWDTDYVEDMRTLDVHISWLRKALEDDPTHPDLIKTIRGKGYLLRL
ncbi:MAG TPA: response regulator transcription factor [Anaerolineaceae bacterium]|jgi:DNA-binding response OmpR family regulator|nr:response regulator transcription factor [Anaerolineaceae bacterium]